jgi:hypothetical protein
VWGRHHEVEVGAGHLIPNTPNTEQPGIPALGFETQDLNIPIQPDRLIQDPGFPIRRLWTLHSFTHLFFVFAFAFIFRRSFVIASEHSSRPHLHPHPPLSHSCYRLLHHMRHHHHHQSIPCDLHPIFISHHTSNTRSTPQSADIPIHITHDTHSHSNTGMYTL